MYVNEQKNVNHFLKNGKSSTKNQVPRYLNNFKKEDAFKIWRGKCPAALVVIDVYFPCQRTSTHTNVCDLYIESRPFVLWTVLVVFLETSQIQHPRLYDMHEMEINYYYMLNDCVLLDTPILDDAELRSNSSSHLTPKKIWISEFIECTDVFFFYFLEGEGRSDFLYSCKSTNGLKRLLCIAINLRSSP